MNTQTARFFKGVTTGLVIGAAITMLTDPITDRQRHKLMRKTEGVEVMKILSWGKGGCELED